MASVTIFKESCKGLEDCGICVFVCPKDLFIRSDRMNAAGYIPPELQNEDECTRCQNCMVYCPDMAIVTEGEKEASDAREVAHE